MIALNHVQQPSRSDFDESPMARIGQHPDQNNIGTMVLIAIGVTPLFWEGPWTVSDTDVMHQSFLSVLGTTAKRKRITLNGEARVLSAKQPRCSACCVENVGKGKNRDFDQCLALKDILNLF